MTIESYATAGLYSSTPCRNQIFEMGEFKRGKLTGQDFYREWCVDKFDDNMDETEEFGSRRAFYIKGWVKGFQAPVIRQFL